jgi:Ca2+/Na+ antiporter
MNGQNAMQDNVSKENDTEGKDFNDENPYGYTFLIVDDTGNGKDGLETKKEDKSLKQSDNTNSNDEDDEGDEGEVTVNLSGGFMSPEFDADIYEDYIDEKTKQASNSILKPSSQNSIFTPESNSGAHKYIELKQATKKIDGDSILKNKFSSFDAILNSIPGNFNTGESGLMDSTKKNFFFSSSGSAPKDLTESLLPPTSSSRFSIDFGDNHSEESENKFGVYDDELSTGAYQGVDDEDSSAPSNYEFGDYTNTFSRTSSEQAISVGALLHKNAQAELSSFNTSIPVTRRSQYHTSIRALYWQQLLLRRRLQKSLWLTSWLALPLYGKILAILDFPTVLMRDLTIPTVDKELWSKMYATLQPITSLVFITFVLGKSSIYVGALPLPIFMMFLGIGPSIFIFFTTHTSYPPHNKMFNTIWLLIAFFMCIFWIYFLAGELVTCLTALGRIFEISPAFLGLTLLAWGNSMGQYIYYDIIELVVYFYCICLCYNRRFFFKLVTFSTWIW